MMDDHELPARYVQFIRDYWSNECSTSVLSAIGLRALIEAVCRDRGISGSNLEKLIDGLAINGVLSTAQET